MNRSHGLKRVLLSAAVGFTLALAACDYDVPITTSPTRAVDARLLGNWTLPGLKKSEHMKIRRFDQSNYSISYDGDLYRAHHSDLAGIALVSVQNLEDEQRKYCYFAWRLSDDGKRLTIRTVSKDVIPKESKETAAIAKLIETNRDNPRLFEASFEYTRDP